jgi:hypothetical protein
MIIDKIKENKTLLLIAGIIMTGTFIQYKLSPGVDMMSKKMAYLHYNFVEVLINDRYRHLEDENIYAEIFLNDEAVSTIGGQKKIKFKYDEENKQWRGKFPVPWGAPEGIYSIRLVKDGKKIGWDEIFLIKTRKPAIEIKEPFKIMNLESMKRIKTFKARGPFGKRGNYKVIYDWMEYIGSNTLFYIAGQTASYKKNDIKSDYPWVKDNLETLKMFSSETKKRGLNFGGWISCFRTFGKRSLKPEWYKYSYKYRFKSNTVYETDGISILDNRRVDDIVDLVKELNEVETVDYIGLDYIRPAGGGLELVSEFVKAMEIDVPDNWENYSSTDRMKWLGRIVTRSNNRGVSVIDKWNWWRAQRISRIIRRIKEDVDLKKPLWTFVLSWELGHQHGQDPYMFNDAGIDLITIMMYETDAPRYDHILSAWSRYLKDNQTMNIAIGNQIDWILHQNTIHPSGPAEYARRLDEGIKQIGNLKGVFFNDFARAMWGRLGPYKSAEWLLAGASTFKKVEETPYVDIKINIPEKVKTSKKFAGSIEVKNLTDKVLKGVRIDFPQLEGVSIHKEKDIFVDVKPGKTESIEFSAKITGRPGYRLGRYMIPVRVIARGRVYVDFKYLWVKGVSLDIGRFYR